MEEVKRLEERPMPPDIDYLSIEGLRLEARQKLDAIRPKNLGQAGRVSGVSPADMAVLMVYTPDLTAECTCPQWAWGR